MDYPRGKFGDCSFSRFGSVVWTESDTHIETLLRALSSVSTSRVDDPS